jgi:hypothetical protein
MHRHIAAKHEPAWMDIPRETCLGWRSFDRERQVVRAAEIDAAAPDNTLLASRVMPVKIPEIGAPDDAVIVDKD